MRLVSQPIMEPHADPGISVNDHIKDQNGGKRCEAISETLDLLGFNTKKTPKQNKNKPTAAVLWAEMPR